MQPLNESGKAHADQLKTDSRYEFGKANVTGFGLWLETPRLRRCRHWLHREGLFNPCRPTKNRILDGVSQVFKPKVVTQKSMRGAAGDRRVN